MSAVNSDQLTRDKVNTMLDTSIYVEAGAGSGKTRALVSRLTSVLASGKATPGQIAAITFTRAAAFEMRSRVRASLEEEIAKAGSERKGQLQEVIDTLDSAAIQTINSFALSLLKERPLPAGLPPMLSPMDEIKFGIDFDERWRQWIGERLEHDEVLASALGIAQRFGLSKPLDSLRSLVEKLTDRYHLLEPRMFDTGSGNRAGVDASLISETLDAAKSLVVVCPDHEDKLFVFTNRKAIPGLERLLFMAGRESFVPAVELVDFAPVAPGRRDIGAKSKWAKASGGERSRDELNEVLRTFQNEIDDIVSGLRNEILSVLLSASADFTLDYAAQRRRTGAVTFHDQLVLARDLLRDDPETLRLFRDRYKVILVDEFQDTDPLQVDLLRLLSGLNDEGSESARLFLVGDPKQSIYRFRGADPSVAVSLTDDVSAIGEPLSLSENHRSQAPILNWVNHVFSNWMSEGESAGQARYKDLDWPDQGAEASVDKGSVRWFGGERDVGAAGTRALEFREISWIARSAGRGGFEVKENDGALRPSTYGDLAVLIKTRTGMEELEDQLITAGVPYVFEGQSPLFNSQDVRDLRSCLIAIDDPSDQVATLASLRCPAFSCSDTDLIEWKQAGGTFFYLDELTGESHGPVSDAFKALREYHSQSRRVTVQNLVEKFIRERRLREKATLSRTGPERVRRLNMVVELAASVSADLPVTLREFTNWMERQAEQNARIPETVSEGADSNAVRIMTMHASKGLEFPIVVLASARAVSGPRDSAQILAWRDDAQSERVEIQLGGSTLQLHTEGFETAAAQEKSLGGLEDVRLLYVAATRAKDHLLVSRYRGAKEKSPKPLIIKIEELLSDRSDELWEQWEDPSVQRVPDTREKVDSDTAKERDEWQIARAALIEKASQRGYITPTGLKPEKSSPPPLPKVEAESFDGEPGRFGRGAAELGRAVHGLLQHIPLTGWTNVDIERLAAQMADAHGIPDRNSEIVDLATKALSTETLRSAAEAAKRSKAWREVSIAAPIDDSEGALEGQIDLLYEDSDGGLVVVDYKTDRVQGENVSEAARPYLMQMGAYAWAVERLTGKPVQEAVLVFARLADTDISGEYRIPDLEMHKAEAARLARESLSGAPSGS